MYVCMYIIPSYQMGGFYVGVLDFVNGKYKGNWGRPPCTDQGGIYLPTTKKRIRTSERRY